MAPNIVPGGVFLSTGRLKSDKGAPRSAAKRPESTKEQPKSLPRPPEGSRSGSKSTPNSPKISLGIKKNDFLKTF